MLFVAYIRNPVDVFNYSVVGMFETGILRIELIKCLLLLAAVEIAPLMSGVVMDYAGMNSVFYFAGIVSLLFTFTGCYYVWRWSKVNKQG